MKSLAIFACLLGMFVLAGPAVADSDSDSDSDSGAKGRCSIAGTWFGDTDIGFVFLITFNPLDKAHKTFSVIADADANHPSGGGVFPDTVELGTFHGEVNRTGRRTFEQMALAYGRDSSFPSPWNVTIASSATWELSPSCDTAVVVFHAGAFFAGEDPFVDEPFFCYPPITGTYRRVPVIASACEE